MPGNRDGRVQAEHVTGHGVDADVRAVQRLGETVHRHVLVLGILVDGHHHPVVLAMSEVNVDAVLRHVVRQSALRDRLGRLTPVEQRFEELLGFGSVG